MKKLSAIISAFFLLTAVCTNLYANDSGGIILPGGDVQLRKTDGIIMEVESLYMKPVRTNYLQSNVEVNYIFKNITDKEIITEVFFPLPEKLYYRDFDGKEYFHDFKFKLYVNGKEKEYSTHKNYFYWQQTFPANKRVHIKHTYMTHGYVNAGGLVYMLNELDDKIQESKEYSESQKNRDYARASGLFEYILTTANNWNKPIRSFNLLVEGFSGADVCFERKLDHSSDIYYAKNIINFSPSGELFFMFNQKLIGENDMTDWDAMDDFANKTKFSDAKLYKVGRTAKISDNPEGKEIGEVKVGEYVWVVESVKNWRKIVQNDLRGWTHKKHLIDTWTIDK